MMPPTPQSPLNTKPVAVLVADGCDDGQLFFIRSRLRAARIAHEIIAPLSGMREEGAITPLLYSPPRPLPAGVRPNEPLLEDGDRVEVTHTLPGLSAVADYAGLIIIGGLVSTETLRLDPAALDFIQSIDSAEKPLATIGHASALLISLDLLRERAVTGAPSIRHELVNSGGIWLDRNSVMDGNRVSCRQREDLPALFEDFLQLLESGVPLISREFRRTLAKARVS